MVNSTRKQQEASPQEELVRIIESARRMGVEIDEEEALQWLAAMAVGHNTDAVEYDMRAGIFGHKITLLDFSPAELQYFRTVGRLVEIHDEPGVVETALSLSGSAAQSKVQTYPGDADYFERVNILAPSRAEACRILARVLRDKALSTLKGPTYQLIQVRFGNYPYQVMRNGRTMKAGSSIGWTAEEIRAGYIEAKLPNGAPVVITWDEAGQDPGWCKLDWIVADPQRGRLANASNMLDVTWQAPDGSITPLDGYLDPYFQEVYLEANSIPIFAKLAKHVAADAVDHYVEQLENEVRKYLAEDVNYGKMAKRLYNIFRLNGRYVEAAYLRELFDEPAAALYQGWALVRSLDEALHMGQELALDNLLAQADQLIVTVIDALEGEEEQQVVKRLIALREALARRQTGQSFVELAETARRELIDIANDYFRDRLLAVPSIQSYLERLRDRN
ncbi:MAG: hypothetical protein RMN25_07305 [Anaerolineae bacterium]|nr:hypothetical protein [Thermoflexales bacterium]MDW8407576.1 hypothetical protein [Anaerolineae bacterium]